MKQIKLTLRITLLLICSIPLQSALVRAADVESLYPMSSLVMPEMLIGVGTRATAMGGAGTALSDNVDSLYWNPAGLGHTADTWLELTHASLFQDVTQEFAAFGLPVTKGQSVAVGVDYFNLGAVDKTGVTANGQIVPNLGTFTPNLLGINLGYGTTLAGGTTLGVGGKYFSENLGDTTQQAMALDIGCQLPFKSGLVLGGVLQNLGPAVGAYSLPMELRVGVGSPFKLSKSQKINAAVDLEVPVAAVSQSQLHLGGEYSLSQVFFLRAGFVVSDLNSLGPLSGLTAGLGLNLGSWSLGYAFAPLGNLGNTHRVSLNLDFSTMFPPVAEVPEVQHKNKTRSPGEPRMTSNVKSAGDGTELSKHPNRPPVLPSSGNSVDDERMMRTLVKKGLTVKVEVQAGDAYPRQVEFTIQRGVGPKIIKWMLTITDLSDRTIAALSGDGMPASIIWDGKNKNNKAVHNLAELSYDLVLVDVNSDQETTNGMLEQPEGVVGLVRGAAKGSGSSSGTLSPQTIVSGARGAQGEKLLKDKKVAVIYFEQGRAEITTEGSEKVGTAVESMKRYPKAKILLLGFCDPADEKTNALLLSKNRAETIMRYLTAYYKISVSRISVQPKGDKEPVVRAEDERLRNKNRRVEIVLQPGQQ